MQGSAVGEKFSNAFSGLGSQLPPTTHLPLHFRNLGGTSAENFAVYTKWDGRTWLFLTRGSCTIPCVSLSLAFASTLNRLCDHMQVTYNPSILSWEPHKLPSSWEDLAAFEGWFGNVVASSGWITQDLLQEPPYPPDLTELQKELVAETLPFYERLKACGIACV